MQLPDGWDDVWHWQLLLPDPREGTRDKGGEAAPGRGRDTVGGTEATLQHSEGLGEDLGAAVHQLRPFCCLECAIPTWIMSPEVGQRFEEKHWKSHAQRKEIPKEGEVVLANKGFINSWNH